MAFNIQEEAHRKLAVLFNAVVLGLKALMEAPPFASFVSFVKQDARKNCLNDWLVTSHPALSLSFQFLSMWECLKLSILKFDLFPWTPWSTYGSQRVVCSGSAAFHGADPGDQA